MATKWDVSETPSTGTLAIWQLVAQLLAAGWTQLGSGDGTTFANGSSGPVVSGAAGTTGLGNTNAWVRLRCPTMTYASTAATRELVIQRGASDLLWWIRYSQTSGFSGGSPSATVAPTASDQVNLWGTTSAGTQFFGTNSTYRCHVMTQDAAPYGFYMVGYQTGNADTNGFSRFILMLDPIQQAFSLDKDPYALVCWAQSNNKTMSLYAAGSGQLYSEPANGVIGLMSTTVATNNYVGLDVASYYQGFNGGNGCPVEPFGNQDVVLPVMYGRRSAQAAPNGPKGFSTFLYLQPVGRVTGDIVSIASVGAMDHLVFGDVVVPWNGTTAVV